jgi:hypothetical protein
MLRKDRQNALDALDLLNSSRALIGEAVSALATPS